MQPAASGIDGASGVKLIKGEVLHGEGPVNDEKFWRRRIEDVPVDEVCLILGICGKSVKSLSTAFLPQILQ
jgi:hypothetical protein